MVFFLTAALYAVARTAAGRRALAPRAVAATTALLALRLSRKAGRGARARAASRSALGPRPRRQATRRAAARLAGRAAAAILWLYDRRVASLRANGTGPAASRGCTYFRRCATPSPACGAFAAKCTQFRIVIGMLRETMLGGVSFLLALVAFVALPWFRRAARALLWGGWPAASLYIFVVVTVERVDYYMYPLLPLCALVVGGALARFVDARPRHRRRAGGALRAARARADRSAVVALLASRAAGRGVLRLQRAGLSQRRSRSTGAPARTRSSSSATTDPTCSTTSIASAGRRTPYSGRRSTKRARSEKARATSSRSKTTACAQPRAVRLAAALSRYVQRPALARLRNRSPKHCCRARKGFWRAFRGRASRPRPRLPRRSRHLPNYEAANRQSSARATRERRPVRPRCCRETDSRARSRGTSTRPIIRLKPADHQLLHERALETEEIGERDRE